MYGVEEGKEGDSIKGLPINIVRIYNFYFFSLAFSTLSFSIVYKSKINNCTKHSFSGKKTDSLIIFLHIFFICQRKI